MPNTVTRRSHEIDSCSDGEQLGLWRFCAHKFDVGIFLRFLRSKLRYLRLRQRIDSASENVYPAFSPCEASLPIKVTGRGE